MQHRLPASGFTLIEILMVVVLIAIVSAVAIPQFVDFRSDARRAVTQDRLASFRTAIVGDSKTGKRGFLADLGRVPNNLNELTSRGALATYDPITKIGWNGPYVDGTVSDWNRDAWGTNLSLDTTNRLIRSCGSDLSCGNADDLTVTY